MKWSTSKSSFRIFNLSISVHVLLPKEMWHVQNGRFQYAQLHFAAKNGHLDLCELIIMNIKNKNPRNMLNETPMFLAAVNYHNAVCDLFLKRP